MADRLTAKVLGREELAAWFKQLSDGVAEEALSEAGLAMALPVQNAAKEKAPKRTRNLSRSIHAEIAEVSKVHVVAVVGTDVEYAAIHEYGGVITPKNAKYLAIPLTEAARAHAGGPRSYPGQLTPRFNKGSAGSLVDEQGVAQFALVRSVTIPARPYLRPALDENEAAAVDVAGIVLRKYVEKASGQ